MPFDIQQLYEQGRKNWESYVRSKRATGKSPEIETFTNVEGLAKKTGLDLMNEELYRQRLYPQRYLPGEAGVISTGMETGPESPRGIGARVSQFVAERQFGEGGTEQKELGLKERLANWQWHPGDAYNPPGFYPAQEKAKQTLEQEQLAIAKEALNKFPPEAGLGDFEITDPRNPKKKKSVQNVPYVLIRQDDGTFKVVLPKLDEGTATQGGTTSMPAPGVQSFTPGETNWQQPPTEPTPSYNYLRKPQQPQTGEALAAKFGNAQTAEDKQRILSEMSTQERGVLRQHLLSQQTVSTSAPATMSAEQQRRRRQALLARGIR